jgi:hypothetical protein
VTCSYSFTPPPPTSTYPSSPLVFKVSSSPNLDNLWPEVIADDVDDAAGTTDATANTADEDEADIDAAAAHDDDDDEGGWLTLGELEVQDRLDGFTDVFFDVDGEVQAPSASLPAAFPAQEFLDEGNIKIKFIAALALDVQLMIDNKALRLCSYAEYQACIDKYGADMVDLRYMVYACKVKRSMMMTAIAISSRSLATSLDVKRLGKSGELNILVFLLRNVA